MYWQRQLAPVLQQTLAGFPAVLVTQPRQSGKTTFLRHEAGEQVDYISFDDPLERDFAAVDPAGFLARFADRPVILDEIQYVLALFPHIKTRIDAAPGQCGRWLLTGSQQFGLMRDVRLIRNIPDLRAFNLFENLAATRQPDAAAALVGSMGCALLEGWVVTEMVKVFMALGRKPDLYF